MDMSFMEPIYSSILLNDGDSQGSRCAGNIYVDGKNIKPRIGEYESIAWHIKVKDNGNQEDTEVSCTYCVNRSVAAVRSCTLCEASLCSVHLNVHSKSKEHVFMAPMKTFDKAENVKCAIHNEVLKYYCFEDASCICVSCCLAGIHKNHQIEPLTDTCARKKKELKNVLEKLLIQQIETDSRVQTLQSQKATIKEKASKLSAKVSDLFIDLRYQMDNLELRILNEIAKEESNVSEPISLLLEKLEQQRDDLSRNIKLLEQLCNVSNPITILQKSRENHADLFYPKSRPSLLCDPEDLDEALILVTVKRSLDDIMARMKTWHCTSDVTMDVSTAANDIYVSGDKKTVSWSKINQRRQKTSERFKTYQVMSNQSFSSGRHYWEVEISNSGKWIMGVCYPSMDRKGELSVIGNNDKSWGLGYIDKKLKLMHDRTQRHLSSMLPCQRIGVYLDYEAGQMSFYEVSEGIRHIHTFITTFTEPVHAVFWVWYGWLRVTT
ncbi:E3 ubiquitin-protein ligase TRIM39-like [Ranitomeya imitator]|uniref:E3 ubiquitin-protein ligase TRIM39-like n=1 Tax=Ranitomeya imitator TaxID=111125 RepID=UPI0037E9B8A3